MNNKILYFEGAGCEGTQVNDVNNCRIRTTFINDEGQKIYLEINAGCKIIKRKNKYESIKGYAKVTHLFYITDENKEKDIFKDYTKIPEFQYTLNNILSFVNKYCNCNFMNIEILPWLSGYHAFNFNKEYNFMNDFINIPARTKARRKIYNEVAKEYFTNIYKRNIKEKNLNPYKYDKSFKYNTWSLVSMDDETITLRSHTYKELINDNERVKTFKVEF